MIISLEAASINGSAPAAGVDPGERWVRNVIISLEAGSINGSARTWGVDLGERRRRELFVENIQNQ